MFKIAPDTLKIVCIFEREFFLPIENGAARFRIELLECQILHLGGYLVEAHTPRERAVDIHRLTRGPFPAGSLLAEMQRAHVVKPVGQLHEQDADVARCGENEFLEVLGLRQLLGAVFQLVQLGDPIDQFGDVGAKAHLDIADIDVGIFDHVM